MELTGRIARVITHSLALTVSLTPGARAQPVNSLVQHLVGHWRMVGNVRGKHATYDLVARRVLDGRFVETHMEDVARPAQYESLVFVGEDTGANHIIVHWLDSFGGAYSIPYGEGAVSGDTLRFEIPYPGSPFRDTFVYQRVNNAWTFRIESSDRNGGWKNFAEYAVTPK